MASRCVNGHRCRSSLFLGCACMAPCMMYQLSCVLCLVRWLDTVLFEDTYVIVSESELNPFFLYLPTNLLSKRLDSFFFVFCFLFCFVVRKYKNKKSVWEIKEKRRMKSIRLDLIGSIVHVCGCFVCLTSPCMLLQEPFSPFARLSLPSLKCVIRLCLYGRVFFFRIDLLFHTCYRSLSLLVSLIARFLLSNVTAG